MHTYFVVSNSGHYGRGAAPSEALKNCLKAGARHTDSGYLKIILNAVPDECTFGGNMFTAPAGATSVPAISLTKISAIRA